MIIDDGIDPAGRQVNADADQERYNVYSRLEIMAILRGLQQHAELATAYFGSGGDFIVTMLLAVNPAFEEVILDYGADERANARLLQAGRLVIVSQLAHVRIQFAAEHIEPTIFDGLPAFRVRVPTVLSRLQRREYYRVRIPARHAARCWFGADGLESRPSARILDLSCGGACLGELSPALRLTPGMRLRGCEVSLAESDTIALTLDVVRSADVFGESGTVMRRVGVRFAEISAADRSSVQRYVNRVQAELLAPQ